MNSLRLFGAVVRAENIRPLQNVDERAVTSMLLAVVPQIDAAKEANRRAEARKADER